MDIRRISKHMEYINQISTEYQTGEREAEETLEEIEERLADEVNCFQE
jgi:hypothetical protein